MTNGASKNIKAVVSHEEVQRLRDDLNFYMKLAATLQKEKNRLERVLGLRVRRERKRFSERASKLGRVCRDIYDFILSHPGLTTKEIQEKWPEHKYGYRPTTFDNRVRELREPHPEWGWNKPLVVSIVEEDGLQHHYPNVQDSIDEGARED